MRVGIRVRGCSPPTVTTDGCADVVGATVGGGTELEEVDDDDEDDEDELEELVSPPSRVPTPVR